MSDQERQLLGDIRKAVQSSQYDKALALINSEKEENGKWSSLKFLWGSAGQPGNALGLADVSIEGLLKRSAHLGERGWKTVLSALDDSDEAFAQWIDQSLVDTSTTSHHVAMQAMHTSQAVNDKIVFALNRFADIKNLPI